jgi:hypothetical protein
MSFGRICNTRVVQPNSIGVGAFVSCTTRDTIAPPAIWLPENLEAMAGFVTRLGWGSTITFGLGGSVSSTASATASTAVISLSKIQTSSPLTSPKTFDMMPLRTFEKAVFRSC